MTASRNNVSCRNNSRSCLTTLVMSMVLICLGCMAVLSFSSYSHSSNNSGSNRHLKDSFRYNYNTLRDELSTANLSANSATENVNVQSPSTNNVNYDHNSSSSNRHLSKHIKQLKEQSQQFDYYYRHAPLNIDYTQFSCDSMNDPDLLVQLHERLRKEWGEEGELKKKKKRKRKKKMKKRMVESDLDELQSTDDNKGIDDGRQLSLLSDNTIQEDERDGHTLESSLLLDKCQFAKTCNDGEGVGFGATLFCSRRHSRHESASQVPSSTTAASASEDGSLNVEDESTNTNDNSTIDNYTTTASFYIKQTLTILLLLLTLLLLFRLLNSTTDEFFSPGLEHFSLQLGLPPRFAGVTLLALGNGAPDVAAIVNATLDSTEGYLMALGELTGTGMFVSGVILGVIVGLNDERGLDEDKNVDDGSGQRTIKRGIPCQGPLLRDIAVLILVCVVAMSYMERGVVDYGFVYTLLAMYFVYVLTVLGADAYHLLYHLPRVRRSGSGVIDGSFVGDGENRDASMEVGERGMKCHGKGEGDVATNLPSERIIANEQTPLVATSSSVADSYHHHQQSLPLHTHSIRDTVIEAMSNYTCDEELQQEEQIVIFHPHHAVHPHHENGAMFLQSVFRGSDAFRRGNSTSPKASRRSSRQLIRKSVSDGITSFRSWSNSDSSRLNQNDCGVLSTCKGVKRLSSPDRLTTAISNSPPVQSSCDEECVQASTELCNDNEEESVALCCSSLQRPNSWGEAWKVNAAEFKEHWNDFFLDIYYNEENGALDVILLSMELPFTIIRKLTNPVPCDGYYCRPLVAVSIILSPLWLWYYFNDQFGYDLFSTYIGYVLCGLTLLVGIIVMRFAPGGDGPMDLYMVVPLTLYGFAIAATWLDSIADKLVELLELFGILLEIPSTIMGLTVLAFGNSLQDLIADVSLSRKGLSTMAVTACLAGPIFNLCVGLGLGFWALLKSTGKEEIHVKFPTNIKTGFYFTIANCFLIVFAGIFVGKGVLGRGYGILACGLYLVYVVTSLYV